MKKHGWILISITAAFICLLLGVFLGRNSNKIYVQLQDIQNAPSQPTLAQSPARININTATSQQLQTLPGIREVLAQRIIDYRETYGNFNSIEELMNVSGIGEKKFDDIKEFITVN